jgi:signal peptidase I
VSIRRGLALVFSILVLGGLAFALWPTRFGGQALFVVVRGESMKPTYQQGELLYARKSDDYKVGDIAIYRIPNGEPGQGTLVVHRIKKVLPDGTYLFQGDNKNDPDDVTPNRAHLVGKPIADLGDVPTRALILLPVLLTLLAGIAVTFALWPDKRVPAPADTDAEVSSAADEPQPALAASARSSATAPLVTQSGPAAAARDTVSSSTP